MVPLEKNITFSDKIVLRADQNSFSFRISALGYQAPGMNKLMYKLEGFDNGQFARSLLKPDG